MRFADADYPADPYPGCRPEVSYVHDGGIGHKLLPVPPPRSGCMTLNAPSGFVLAHRLVDLDRWLADAGAPPVAGRTAVLAYGSNACPSKVTWLREHCGLTGPVIVLRAECTGLTAVWASGLRARDGQRPVTLTAYPGVVEQHAVWLATPEQLRVLDQCEGNGQRYTRAAIADGAVTVPDANTPLPVHAYLGTSPVRMPLLVNGHPVRAAELGQAEALELRGVAATGHGVITTPGEPVR